MARCCRPEQDSTAGTEDPGEMFRELAGFKLKSETGFGLSMAKPDNVSSGRPPAFNADPYSGFENIVL